MTAVQRSDHPATTQVVADQHADPAERRVIDAPARPGNPAGWFPGRLRARRPPRDLLREHLLAGGSKRGHRLPHEHVLTRELGCSRNVLREALALLVADGILRRERGRGTAC
jgi:hypothetical protein